MEHQPLGVVLDRLRQAGFPPGPSEHGEGPVIDMDRDRHGSLGVDTDQADNCAKIDDPVDAYA